MVVVLHSQFKNKKCWSCSKDTVSLIFCDHCKSLQDFPLDRITHYEILGLEEKLLIDEGALRTRYYELSKQLHPDRFSGASHPVSQFALRWTTALNRAYQCLKSKSDRTLYLINKGLPKTTNFAKKAIPTDLAEAYFEIQDLLSEGNLEPLLAFKKQLEQLLEENDIQWQNLASEFDLGENKIATLEKLQLLAEKQKYIHSMLADIDRKVSG